jgi:hypothetical protein
MNVTFKVFILWIKLKKNEPRSFPFWPCLLIQFSSINVNRVIPIYNFWGRSFEDYKDKSVLLLIDCSLSQKGIRVKQDWLKFKAEWREGCGFQGESDILCLREQGRF